MPVVETRYSTQCGSEAFRSVVGTEPYPTLVICGNDVLAVGAIQAAHEAGMRVPDDISIVGFDDIELSTIITPALTTVHVPHRDMGRIAAETLLSLVRDSSDPIQIELNTRIVERESLGVPPK